MKKLLVCLLALCALTFTSCNPDPEPINYADDFVGEYIFSATLSIVSEEYVLLWMNLMEFYVK